jgi:hypothetical protein
VKIIDASVLVCCPGRNFATLKAQLVRSGQAAKSLHSCKNAPPHRRVGKDKSLWKEITLTSGRGPQLSAFPRIGSWVGVTLTRRACLGQTYGSSRGQVPWVLQTFRGDWQFRCLFHAGTRFHLPEIRPDPSNFVCSATSLTSQPQRHLGSSVARRSEGYRETDGPKRTQWRDAEGQIAVPIPASVRLGIVSAFRRHVEIHQVILEASRLIRPVCDSGDHPAGTRDQRQV